MPRRIEVADDAFRLHYSGLSSWIMILRTVEVPYTEIEQVDVGLEPLPRFYFRIGQYLPRKGIIRGRFKGGGRWFFFDLHHRERAVVLRTIPGSHYKLLAFEPTAGEDPAQIAAEIRARL